MNQFDTTLANHIARSTGRAYKLIDVDAAEVGRIVDQWYAEVVKLSATVPDLLNRIDAIGRHYSRELYRRMIETLERRGIDSYSEQAAIIREHLPERAKLWILGHARETLDKPQAGGTLSPLNPLAPRLPGIKLALPSLDTAIISTLSKEARDKLFAAVVLKPMSRATVRNILVQQNIVGHIAPLTSRVPPHTLVSVISRAHSQGMTRAEIARKELEPLFHGVKSASVRVARDSGTLVTTHANLQAFQGLGPLLLGYRCNCVTDKNSRPWHQARKGVIFWINPKPGQKGMSACPQPPYEPHDESERPPGTPKLAYNCRCYLSPITRSMLALEK